MRRKNAGDEVQGRPPDVSDPASTVVTKTTLDLPDLATVPYTRPQSSLTRPVVTISTKFLQPYLLRKNLEELKGRFTGGPGWNLPKPVFPVILSGRPTANAFDDVMAEYQIVDKPTFLALLEAVRCKPFRPGWQPPPDGQW